MEHIWIKDDKFKELSADEVEKLEANDLADYYNAKNKHDKEILKTLIDNKASKEDIDSATKKLENSVNEQLVSLNKALKEQGLAIKKIARADIQAEKVSFGQSVRKALEENIDNLKALKSRDKNASFSVEVKAAGTMLTNTNISGGNVPVEEREAGLGRIKRRTAFVSNDIVSGTTSSPIVSWVDQVNADGGAGGTAEGATKNQADFDLVVVNESLKKRTVFIKVSTEMLDDIDFMQSEIETELMELIELDIDDQLLNGDDTGENMNGILTQATAYDAGSFANTVDEANNWDVLQTAITQVIVANHQPNVVYMNPIDVTKMKLTKGTDGHYVLPPFTSADGMQVDALPVRANNGVPVDNFLVMDGTRAKAYFKNGISMNYGYENDDFTKNLITVLAEARGLLRIRTNDATAFVTGDFTTAKAALETV